MDKVTSLRRQARGYWKDWVAEARFPGKPPIVPDENPELVDWIEDAIRRDENEEADKQNHAGLIYDFTRAYDLLDAHSMTDDQLEHVHAVCNNFQLEIDKERYKRG